MALAHHFSFIAAPCAPWLDVALSFCSWATIKCQCFFVKIICWRQPGLPSIFLRAQLCGFKITLVYRLIWNNLKIQYFINIWDGFTFPSLMDTVQDRNHYFLVIPVITLNKPRAVHSRPQIPSFLGHMVGKRGALEGPVTGCQKISDIRSRMCRSYKYYCSCS